MLGRGVLVAFEGIDGAGKTTQACLLEEHLKAIGIPTVRSKEPTNGPFGSILKRSALEGRLSVEEELETFIADRRDHITSVIGPGLEAGSVVIVDRYFFSTAAYQGARGLDPDLIVRKNETFAPIPDALFLLEIDCDTAIERISRRGGPENHFERRDYLRECAEIFASLDREYVVRIDGKRPVQDIHRFILQALDKGPIFRALCLREGLEECEPELCSHRILGECDYPSLDLAREPGGVDLHTIERIAQDPNRSAAQKLKDVRGALGGRRPRSKSR